MKDSLLTLSIKHKPLLSYLSVGLLLLMCISLTVYIYPTDRHTTEALSNSEPDFETELNLIPSQELNLSKIGIEIKSPAFLGKTVIQQYDKTVDIGTERSVAKVVRINPEHDTNLNAEMNFSYDESILDDVQEEDLILYSSIDDGLTWVPHFDSRVDIENNSIHLDGIEHFSLWTAASMSATLDANGEATGVTFTDGAYLTLATSTVVPDAPGGIAADLGLWFKADAGTNTTTEGAAVTSWTEQSSSGNNLTGIASPVYRNNTFNYNPGVEYTAAARHQLATEVAAPSTTMYVVGSPGGDNAELWSHEPAHPNQNGGDVLFYVSGGNKVGYYDGSGASPTTPSLTWNTGEIALFRAEISNAPNYNISYTKLGGSPEQLTSVNTQDLTEAYEFLGNWNLNNGVQEPFGLVAETMVYNSSTQTAIEKQQIESYLALKYGITLDQSVAQNYLLSDGTTVVWDATTNAVYSQDIAGIGQDDMGTLLQKQSKSVNANGIVAIGLSDIAATNQANAATFAADKSFMVWGNNGGAATWTATGAPTNYEMLSRQWRVQETGTVGAVKMQFDVGDADFDVPVLNMGTAYYLIYDSNNNDDLSDESPITLTNSSGNIWETTANIDLADGMEFTLATSTVVPDAPGGIAADLGLWFKADAGTNTTTEGAVVTSWTEQSSSGNNLTGIASPVYRNNTFNYNPGVEYPLGTAARHELTTRLSAQNTTMYVVGNPGSDFAELWSGDADHPFTNGSDVFLYLQGGNKVSFYEAPGVVTTPSLTWNPGEISLYRVELSNATNYNATYTKLAGASETLTSVNNSDYPGDGYAILGNWNTNDGALEPFGLVAETMVYNSSTQTAIEKQQIESYLALKYGITLSQTTAQNYILSDGTTVVWDATANAAYSQDIAGIGQDDMGTLLQKQSKSVNANGIVAIGLSDIAATNQANAATFAADKSFMVWGNNGGAATWTATGAPTNYEMLSRQWRVQETGTVGAVKMQFDVGDADFDVPVLNMGTAYYLIYDSNNNDDLSDESPITLTNSSGNIWETTANIDLADGMEFTLATSTVVPDAPGGIAADLGLWFKADAGTNTTTEGAVVTSWTEQSSSGNNLTGIASPVYRNNTFNYNPGVEYPLGTAARHELTTRLSAQNTTMYVVGNPGSDFAELWSGDADHPFTNGSDVFLYLQGGNKVSFYEAPGVVTTPSLTWNPGEISLYRVELSNATNYNATYTKLAGASETLTSVNNSDYPGDGYAILGNWNTNDGALEPFGLVAETMVYNSSTQTAIEKQQIESYLALKYGITLDQSVAQNYLLSDGTTVVWDATTNAVYSQDIAGIGQDDMGTLLQKQSKSVNADGIVAIGLSDIAATNQANAATFAADKSFMVWGNNGGAATWTATGAPTNYEMLSRQWRVQETGTVGAVKMQFDVGDADFDVPVLNMGTAYYLIYDSNNNDDLGDESPITLTNSSGNIWETTANIDLADGMEFTLATSTVVPDAPGGIAADLGLWFKADAGTNTTTEGAVVTSWTEQSSSGNNLTGIASPVYRNNTFNYNPGVEYPLGTAARHELTTRLSAQNTTMYVVGNPGSDFAELWSGDADHPFTNGSDVFLYLQGGNKVSFYEAPGVVTTPSLTWNPGEISLYRVELSNATNYNATYTKLAGASETLTSVNNSDYPGDGYAILGNWNTNDGALEPFGLVAETMVYNSSTQTAIEKQQIESYLALKYGITLSQTTAQNYILSDGTTVVWDATANAAYSQDIAGIGQDDMGTLLQKQSKSVNANGIVAIGLSDIAATNQANAATFAADKSFMVWGNNGGAATWTATGAPTNYEMLSRQWRVQETGTVGAVKMQFDVGDADFDVPVLNMGTAYYLIYDSNNNDDLSDETPITLTNSSGNIWETTANIDLADGMEFTLATSTVVPDAPGGVAGLDLWFKADAGTNTTTEGAVVTSWTEQSSSGNNLTGIASPVYRNNTFNYNPGVEYPLGTAARHELTTRLSAQNTTMYVVGNPGSDFAELWSGDADHPFTNGSDVFLYLQGGNKVSFYEAPGVVTTPSLTWNPGEISLYRVELSNATNYNATYTKLAGASETLTSVNNSDYPGDGYAILGNWNTNDGALEPFGLVAETMVYNSSTQTAIEKQQIESYLALKYGITLSQTTAQNYILSDGTTVVWDATANAAYSQDIAGIGQDDMGTLLQKQSKSVNANGIVAIGLSDIAATNQANAATFAADKSFMVWGNNGGAATWTATGAPTNYEMLSRQWRVQETGTVGAVKMQFDVGDADFDVPVLNMGTAYYLIYDSNNNDDLSDETPITLTNSSGNIWETTANIDLADGMEFTLATSTVVPDAPGGVAGLDLWFKADAGTNTTTEGAVVTSWTEQSSSGNNLTGIASPVYRNNTFNYNPGVEYPLGTAARHELTTRLSAQNTTMYVVGNPGSDFAELWSGDADHPFTNGSDVFLYLQGGNKVSFYEAPGVVTTPSLTWNPGEISLYRVELSNATNYNATYTKLAGASETLTSVNNSDYPGDGYAILGNWNTNDGALEPFGLVAETMVYNSSTQTAIEKQQIESYLALKYGITLSQTTAQNYILSDGTTVVWDATANAAYSQDIAGIGQDDMGTLLQKQSKSVNANGIVAIGLSDIAATNQANAATFAADKSFMVWGNNGGAATWTATGAPTNYEMLSRQWRVQETGTVGAVKMQFDVGDADFDVPVLNMGTAYYLIYDSNNNDDLSDESPITLTNSTGNIWETGTNVNLADGAEFTLATSTVAPDAPGGVAGLDLWFKADAGVMGTTSVTQWDDQSGLNRHVSSNNFTNPTVTNLTNPALVAGDFNYNPVLDFDSNLDALWSTNFSTMLNDDDIEVFMVMKEVAAGSRKVVAFNLPGITDAAAAFDHGIFYPNAMQSRDVFGGAPILSTTDGDMSGYMRNFYYGGATPGSNDASGAIRTNGLEVATTAGFPQLLGTERVAIGSAPGTASDEGFVGKLAEVVVYNSNLSGISRQQIDSYLALKYGLTIDQTVATNYLLSDGTTVVWDATANAAYNNDIAGIGQDDTGTLLQKQSKSVNVDGIVAIGLSDIAATNQANAATFAADKNFMVWGNNNGAATWTTTGAPTNYEMLSRQWRVQETGTVGAVKMQFDVANVSFDVPALLSGTDYYFIYDTNDNGDLSDETPVALTNSSGGIWETSTNVNFTDGMEFTLATASMPIDTDGDGITDDIDPDDDNDGILDIADTGDTDGDGIPDSLESNIIDSDGDGTNDYADDNADNEGTNDGTGGEQDGVETGLWNDIDNDGIPDHLDGSDGSGTGTDITGSGDTDNDGLSDAEECPDGFICPDSDGDGIPDYADNDSDNDGIDDIVECPTGAPCNDTDNDGIADNIESNTQDTDGDGMPDYNDTNADGDSPATNDDIDGGDGLADADGDGIPNYLDAANGTGGGTDIAACGDSDSDGLSDCEECPDGIICPDTDGDGQPDYMDTDSDNDGINDLTDIAPTDPCSPNILAGTCDQDSDGLTNDDEAALGTDPTVADTDNDGLMDGEEACNYSCNFSWATDAINDPCRSVTVFNFNGNTLVRISLLTTIGCYSDSSDAYYDCEGNLVCSGGSIFFPSNCPVGLEAAASNGNPVNAVNELCSDPLDPCSPNTTIGICDEDNDGLTYDEECPTGAPCADMDNDGIPDNVESNTQDTDGDGNPDFDDADADGDSPTDNDSVDDGDGLADTDGDGIPNYLDVSNGIGFGTDITACGDSDSDGLSDCEECPDGITCPDTDGDGIPDYMDTDSDDDGTTDMAECPAGAPCTDTDGDGIPDNIESNTQDTDGDGNPDFDDSDADGDGAGTDDSDDGGTDQGLEDADGDGIPNYLDASTGDGSGGTTVAACGDSDADGLSDCEECPDGVICPDNDGDGIPDYMDEDSDNDGTTDMAECPTGAPCTDTDGDGIPDNIESNTQDTDGDGNPDFDDSDADGDGAGTDDSDDGGTDQGLEDADGDGIPNYLDASTGDGSGGTTVAACGDSDADGLSDCEECPDGVICPDNDGDGIPDYMDEDSDNDGTTDMAECPTGAPCTDTDGDGIPDNIESNTQDTDGDGNPDYDDSDADGDGAGTDDSDDGGTDQGLEDTDGDGIPNYLDASTGDGSGGTTVAACGDSDADGLSDCEECPDGLICPDSDGDGIPDYMDEDSDNDGTTDMAECPAGAPCTDTDGDGIPDNIESNTQDTDGDGNPDYDDSDADGDGAGTDDSNDGGTDQGLEDADGDGIPNYLDASTGDGSGGTTVAACGDSDADGLSDCEECPDGVICPDSDGDGIPDYMDEDSDNDGTTDMAECPSGAPCTDTDGDGIPDNIESNTQDTDGDGNPDYDDSDADGDGAGTDDSDDGGTDQGLEDADSDGIPNYLDASTGDGSGGTTVAACGDSDADGLSDCEECPDGVICPDSDGDGIPDYMDEDSDNDGTTDMAECPSGAPCADTDNDGIPDNIESNTRDTDGDGDPDYDDSDADGDGAGTDDSDDGGADQGLEDADGDGIPNYLDASNGTGGGTDVAACGDSDSDGISDCIECPDGIECPDTDNDGQPDYMQAAVETIKLKAKAFLAGAYNNSTGMMTDALRTMSLIPTSQPYATHPDIAYTGAESTTAAVFTPTGADAIVDWVIIELRDAADATSVIETKAALIQRDGDIVDTDGTSDLSLSSPEASYYVAVRHRNHLGTMTASPVALSDIATTVDFTVSTTALYENTDATASVHATQEIDTDIYALWAGNYSSEANTGDRIIYQGSNGDNDAVFFKVLLDPANTDILPLHIVSGTYDRTDGNLDGQVIYQGAGADIDLPFVTVGVHGDNPTAVPIHVVYEQLPK